MAEKFSHDQAFKNLILDYMLDALRFLFPELTASWPDNVSITPIRQEQLKERLGKSYRELDIPLMVEFLDGSREALIVVVESESRHRKDFLKYLAVVSIEISKLMRTNRVVPAVVYPFQKKPVENQFSLNDGKRIYLDFNCVSCALGNMKAVEYERSRNLVARLCLPLMAQNPEDKLRLIARAYEGLVEFEPDFGKRYKYSDFISHYGELNEKEADEFSDEFVEQSPFKEDIMTLASIWKSRGLAEGKAEGMAEGKAEGLAEGRAKGKAEGAIGLIIELSSDKIISSVEARTRLKMLVEQGIATKEMVARALKKISK